MDHTGLIYPCQVFGNSFVAKYFVRKLAILNGLSQVGSVVCLSSTALDVLFAVCEAQHTLRGFPCNVCDINKEKAFTNLEINFVIILWAGYDGNKVTSQGFCFNFSVGGGMVPP